MVGKKVLFHGLMIYMGEIVKETPLGYTVVKSCWMGDMGVRFHILLANGIHKDTEIEMAPPDLEVVIPRGGFVVYEWHHDLPTKSQ